MSSEEPPKRSYPWLTGRKKKVKRPGARPSVHNFPEDIELNEKIAFYRENAKSMKVEGRKLDVAQWLDEYRTREHAPKRRGAPAKYEFPADIKEGEKRAFYSAVASAKMQGQEAPDASEWMKVFREHGPPKRGRGRPTKARKAGRKPASTAAKPSSVIKKAGRGRPPKVK